MIHRQVQVLQLVTIGYEYDWDGNEYTSNKDEDVRKCFPHNTTGA
jgi:hypothetical protein